MHIQLCVTNTRFFVLKMPLSLFILIIGFEFNQPIFYLVTCLIEHVKPCENYVGLTIISCRCLQRKKKIWKLGFKPFKRVVNPTIISFNSNVKVEGLKVYFGYISVYHHNFGLSIFLLRSR